MKSLKRRLGWFAGILVLLAICAPAARAAEMLTEPPAGWVFPVTKMETLKPSPAEVLKAPDGVTGSFTVAATPPVIEFGVLPGQWKRAYCWSAWGDSLFASDGKYYLTLGEHGAPRGFAYVYQVDPETKEMRMVVDITGELKIPPKVYAPGKVHGPLMEFDGWVYFIGYRGSGAGLNDEHQYKGDPMLRYQLSTGKIEFVSYPAPYYSVPASVIHEPTRMMYGLGAGGAVRTPQSAFFAYDMDKKETTFVGGPAPDACRAVLLAPDGRVYYSTGQRNAQAARGDNPAVEAQPGKFARYDPKTNQVTVTDITVPGNGSLRAASRPNAQGVAYGISYDGVIFTFDTKTEKINIVAKTFEAGPPYVTVCKFSPDERFLYFVPGGHGGAFVAGCPVVQLDTQTGKRKVIAFLHPYMLSARNYTVGGTFGIDINADGSVLGICFNGKKQDDPTSHSSADMFDQVSVMLIHIPESERK